MEMLGVEKPLAKTSSMQLQGNVWRKEDKNVILKALGDLKSSAAEEEDDRNKSVNGKNK